MACEKHAKNPARGYSDCPGCEIESLRTALTDMERQRDEALARAEELRSFAEEMEAYELVDGTEISVPWDEHESPAERATRINRKYEEGK